MSRSDFAKKHLACADFDRLWQWLLLWIDIIISKCLYIKAYKSYCPQPLGELVQRIQLIQGVVWLCCVSWINKSDRQRTVQDLHDLKALANRTSDNRLHRCHPWVNPWKGGHQPGHQDTNNKSMNDTWKNVENCGGLAAWPTLIHWHLQSWMLRCASRVPNITKAVEVRFGSVMMLSTLAAQQETKTNMESSGGLAARALAPRRACWWPWSRTRIRLHSR